jgi:TRAP-type C4-dicarboxylate transport system substrate-binding protein
MRAIWRGLAVVAVAAALAAGCTGSEPDKAGGLGESEPVVLTLANMDIDPTNLDTPAFIEAVERLSGGSIQILQQHGWNSDAPLEEVEERTIADVRAGEADLAVVPARAWDTVGVTSFQALVAPLLVDSYELEERVLQSPLAARMLAGVDELGLVGIAILPGSLRYPLGFSRELVGPEDYEGTTIGIRNSGVAAATFEALGAQTRPYAVGDTEGLAGAELDLITIGTVRYDRAARALTGNVVLWPRPITLFMNGESFARLDPEQQSVLERAGREAAASLLTDVQQESEQTFAYLCQSLDVVTASTGELAALRARVQPVYDELEREELTRELIAGIRAIRSETSAAADEIGGCSPRDDARAADDSELEGRWETTLTVDELVDAGTETDLAELIAGTTVLEFEDGEFRALDATTGKERAAATYDVDGDVVTIVWEHGIGLQPGSSERLRWSVYRDALTFSGVPGREAMPALIMEPWNRAD